MTSGRAQLPEITRRLLEACPRSIVSIRVGGSLARGLADDLSDIDLFVVVQDEAFCDATLSALADALGPYVVRDVPRSSETWGLWATGVTTQFGYVDLMLAPGSAPRTTTMTDPSSLVMVDRDGLTSAAVAASPRPLDLSACYLGAQATAWLKLYKATKEHRRGSILQGQKYLVESLEALVVLHRLSVGRPPPGRNYEQPFRAMEFEDLAIVESIRLLVASFDGTSAALRRGIERTLVLFLETMSLAQEAGIAPQDGSGDEGLNFLRGFMLESLPPEEGPVGAP